MSFRPLTGIMILNNHAYAYAIESAEEFPSPYGDYDS